MPTPPVTPHKPFRFVCKSGVWEQRLVRRIIENAWKEEGTFFEINQQTGEILGEYTIAEFLVRWDFDSQLSPNWIKYMTLGHCEEGSWESMGRACMKFRASGGDPDEADILADMMYYRGLIRASYVIRMDHGHITEEFIKQMEEMNEYSRKHREVLDVDRINMKPQPWGTDVHVKPQRLHI